MHPIIISAVENILLALYQVEKCSEQAADTAVQVSVDVCTYLTLHEHHTGSHSILNITQAPIVS